MGSSKEIKNIEDELQWIYDKSPHQLKSVEKGIFSVLVPLGTLITTGVLATGLYHLYKKDSRKQQMFMRYRVLSQGVTIGLAVACICTNSDLRQKLFRWG